MLLNCLGRHSTTALYMLLFLVRIWQWCLKRSDSCHWHADIKPLTLYNLHTGLLKDKKTRFRWAVLLYNHLYVLFTNVIYQFWQKMIKQTKCIGVCVMYLTISAEFNWAAMLDLSVCVVCMYSCFLSFYFSRVLHVWREANLKISRVLGYPFRNQSGLLDHFHPHSILQLSSKWNTCHTNSQHTHIQHRPVTVSYH